MTNNSDEYTITLEEIGQFLASAPEDTVFYDGFASQTCPVVKALRAKYNNPDIYATSLHIESFDAEANERTGHLMPQDVTPLVHAFDESRFLAADMWMLDGNRRYDLPPMTLSKARAVFENFIAVQRANTTVVKK